MSGAVTRTLILLRHAKSGYPAGVRDHDRPLAERGRREAVLAGDWLRANCPPIDEVLCSTATRTRQTVAAAGITAPIRLAEQIYEAGVEDILGQVRESAESVTTLLVVGHGPGLPGLALELADPDSDPDVLAELRSRYPTAAVAVLTTDRPFAELEYGAAELIAFHIPGPG